VVALVVVLFEQQRDLAGEQVAATT